jgi:hypothetical protein
VRFELQDFVEAGLPHSPPDLRRAGEAVAAAAKSGDWDHLDLDAQAAALVMGRSEQTTPFLDSIVEREPVRALELAVRSAHIYLRFALQSGALIRILDRPRRKPPAQLPSPRFWLALRRAFDSAPLLRGEALTRVQHVEDLRIRAALAFVFPDADSLWTRDDRRQALDTEDEGDAHYFLFATVRTLPNVASTATWPPSVRLLKGLPDPLLEEAQALMHDRQLAQQRRQRASLREAQKDVTPLFENVTAPEALGTLALLEPSAILLEQARAFPETGVRQDDVLRRSFIEGWQRELGRDGPPRDAPWRSPWERVPRRKEAATRPPPPPVLTPGEWERTWQPRALSLEQQMVWAALETRSEVRPWEVSLIVDRGPSILPLLRAWARREPALLAATQEIDDGGLDEALLLAWNSRRVQLSLAVREFARRFPQRAVRGAIRLCFAEVEKERAVGVIVLRAMPREAAAELAALTPEQAGWVERLMSARPPLPARQPTLPDFIRPAALPDVVTNDGQHALSEAALLELVAAFKAAPAEDSAALQQLTAGYSTTSLEQLVGTVFRQWLSAGAPPKEKWALNALAHFPSDEWAAVVGALCQQWAQNGFPARAQDAVAVLGRMGNRVALSEVHRLATRIRTTALRSRARLAFQEAASRLGLSTLELEDRLVPEVGDLGGATLTLDGLRPVMMRSGASVPLTPDVKLAARALKPAVARLERAMSEGPGFGAVHFTETWGMHPLLHALATRVVWGAFRGDKRVGLFVPGAHEVALDDDTLVRPMHPLELSREELERAREWVTEPQPFEQLERACYPATELRGRLTALIGLDVSVGSILSLERLGWERGAVGDGGAWMDLSRRGEGWHLSLHFEPGIWIGDPRASELQTITGSELEPGVLSPRIASELQRDLVKCFFAR